VLVVDDEPHILHYLRATLEAWGHHVTTAADGAAGFDAARTGAWDVIITDLRMPRVSGREFYEALTAEHPGLARRVIFSTGDTVRGDTLAFLERQGLPVLHKPFSLGDLRTALAAATA
jgi:DNA-binding response OmpR family regulator